MYNWSLFLISVGGVLVMMSSTIKEGFGVLTLGVFLMAIGIFLFVKRKKG